MPSPRRPTAPPRSSPSSSTAGQDPQGRAALVAAGHGLAARWRRAGRAPRAAAADGAFPFATCVPFSNNTPLGKPTRSSERSGLLFRAAAHEAPDDALARAHRTPAGPAGTPTHCATPTAAAASAARRGWCAGPTAAPARGLPAGRRHQRRSLDRHRCCARSCRRKATAACCCRRARKRPGGGAVARQAGVHLLQRDRRGDTRPNCGCCTGSRRRSGMAALQGAQKCGTNCGSCIPELKRTGAHRRQAEALASAPCPLARSPAAGTPGWGFRAQCHRRPRIHRPVPPPQPSPIGGHRSPHKQA